VDDDLPRTCYNEACRAGHSIRFEPWNSYAKLLLFKPRKGKRPNMSCLLMLGQSAFDVGNLVGPKTAITSSSRRILSNTYVFTYCHHPTVLKCNTHCGFSSSRPCSCVDGWLGSRRFEASCRACNSHHPTTKRGIPQDTNPPKLLYHQLKISHNFHCLRRFRCLLETRQLTQWRVHLREKL
jgi:hypothetical protein